MGRRYRRPPPELRRRPGVAVETLGEVAGHAITAVHLGCADPTRPPKVRLLVTAGVHGDEPVGPGAAMLLLDQLLVSLSLRQDVSVTIVPVVNPTGLLAGTRENASGQDVNRGCDQGPGAPLEARILGRLLARRGIDLAVDLHSAGGTCDGFFAIHLRARELVEAAMARLARRHPVEGDDDGPYQFQAPGVFSSDNPGTVKGAAHSAGARWAVTTEAPRCLSYLDQVQGSVDLVHELVAEAKARSA